MPTFQDVLNQYPQFQQLSPEEKNKLIQIYTNDPERFNRDISQIDFGYAMLPDEKKSEIVNVLRNDTIKWLDAQIMQGKQIGEIGQPITEEEIQRGQEEYELLKARQEEAAQDVYTGESEVWSEQVSSGMLKEMETIPAEITATALKGYEYLGKGLQKIGFEETGKKIEQEARADVEVLKRNIDKFRAKFSNAEKVGAFITDMIPYAISGWATGAGETLIGNIMRSVIAGTGTYSVMKGYEFEDPEYQKEFKQFLALDVLFPITVTAGFMALNKAYQIAKAKDKLKIAKIFRKEAKTTPKENETELAKELKKVLEDFDKKSPEEKLQEAHKLSEEINKVQKNVEPEIKEKINEEFLKHAEEISNEIKKVESIPEEIKVVEERIKPIEEAKPVEEVKPIENTDIINKLNEYYKQEKERLKKSNMIEENKQKKLKGLAMEYSALKRHLEGNPTRKEIENTINKLNKIYKGKEVIVDGKKGIATGKKVYGKFEIEFEDGTKKFIPKNKIQHNTNHTEEDAINYLKKEATEQTNMLYRAYVKGIKKQPEQIVEKATPTKIKIIEKTPDYAIIENQNTGTRWKIYKEQYDNLDPQVRKIIDEFDIDQAKTIEETKPEQIAKSQRRYPWDFNEEAWTLMPDNLQRDYLKLDEIPKRLDLNKEPFDIIVDNKYGRMEIYKSDDGKYLYALDDNNNLYLYNENDYNKIIEHALDRLSVRLPNEVIDRVINNFFAKFDLKNLNKIKNDINLLKQIKNNLNRFDISKTKPQIISNINNIYKEIDKAVSENIIDEINAKLFKKIIQVLKDEPDFNLEILNKLTIADIKHLSESIIGKYEQKTKTIQLAAKSVEKRKDIWKVFAHEVGHYLYHFLPTEDKLEYALYWSKLLEKSKNEKDFLKKVYQKLLTPKKHYTTPEEFFAEQFSTYLEGKGIFDEGLKKIFEKAKRIFRKIWFAIRGENSIDPELRKIYDKLLKPDLSKIKIKNWKEILKEEGIPLEWDYVYYKDNKLTNLPNLGKAKVVNVTPKRKIVVEYYDKNNNLIKKEEYHPQMLLDEIEGDKKIYEAEKDKLLKQKEPEQVQEIEQALKEGKPVPEEVLKDYPDLAEKYKKKVNAIEPQKLRLGEYVYYTPHEIDIYNQPIKGIVYEIQNNGDIIFIKDNNGIIHKIKSKNGEFTTQGKILEDKSRNIEHNNSLLNEKEFKQKYQNLTNQIITKLKEKNLPVDDIIYAGSFVNKNKSNDIDIHIITKEKDISHLRPNAAEFYENALADLRYKGLPINVIEVGERIKHNPRLDGKAIPIYGEFIKDKDGLEQYVKSKGQIELHAGIKPDIKKAVEMLGKINIVKKIFDALEQYERRLTQPFAGVSKSTFKKLEKLWYQKFRPLVNNVDRLPHMKTKELEKWLKGLNELERDMMNKIIIRYMENPDFRAYIQDTFKNHPELAQKIELVENARQTLEYIRKRLYAYGELTSAQYHKWYGKYLARLYKQGELPTGFSDKIRKLEIKSGRKFEDILGELTPEELEKLGYIPDAMGAIKYSIAHGLQNLAMARYLRDMLKRAPEIVAPEIRPLLVNLDDFPEIKQAFPALPKTMSPQYAWKKLIAKRKGYDGWLMQEVKNGKISKDTFKQFVQHVKSKLKLLEKAKFDKDKYTVIGDLNKLRYDVLTGLPVEKTVAQNLGTLRQMIIEPDPDKINKAVGTLLTLFKVNKVLLNTTAIPRNFISGFFQWAINKGNPISFFKYYPKAIKHAVLQDDFFQMLEKRGLFNTNYSSEEIKKVLNELKPTTQSRLWLNKFFKVIKKLATPYGLVDDLAKMARVEYNLKRGMKLLDAIMEAQHTIYDYSFVPAWIEKARSTELRESAWWKFANTPFVTYSMKTLDLGYQAIKNHPAWATFWITLPVTLKYSIEAYYRKKYGNDYYDYIKALLPEHFQTDTAIIIPNKDKQTVTIITFDYVHPFGQLERYITKGVSGLAKGAIEMVGMGESPLSDTYAALKTGIDPFTGQKIFTDIDNDFERNLKRFQYLIKTFITPATITAIQQYRKTKHPIWTRLFGFNVYTYSLQQLYNMKRAEIANLKSAFYRERAKILGSKLSDERKAKELEELEEKFGHRLKEKLNWEE